MTVLFSLSVLPLSFLLHEVAHYIVARLLGVKASMKLTSLGLTVDLPEYREYKIITEISDNTMRFRYVLIALAPYMLVLAYMLLWRLGLLLTPVLSIILLYHMFSFPLEFYQKNPLLPLAAGAVQAVLLILLF